MKQQKNNMVRQIFLITLMMWSMAQGDMLEFKITRGSEKAHVRWTFWNNPDGTFELKSVNELERTTHHLVCDKSLHTQEWTFRKAKENTNYTVSWKNDSLIFHGSIRGEKVSKQEPCDGMPWYQFHTVSLPQYIRKNAKEVEFLSVQPDDGKVFKLSANNCGIESIIVNGKQIKAYRIEIRLTGIFSRLGHATYWLEVGSLQFVKFKGMKALPGSEPVVYELISRAKEGESAKNSTAAK